MTTRKVPLRRCIGCGASFPKKELIRIVLCEEDISIDMTGKKSGRGTYICKNTECLKKAMKTKGLDRSFRIKVSSDVYERLQSQLEEIVVE